MKRAFFSTCLAAAFAVGLSAQAPAPSPTPSQTPQTPSTAPMSQADRGSGSVTVTGCLRAGDAPNSFVLENIKADKAGTMASTAKPGEPSATGTSGTMANKALEGVEKVDLTGSPSGVTLSSHVGHTVKLTGMLSPKTEASPSASARPAEPGQSSAASASKTPSLNVSALSMVSATCSE